MQRIVDGNYPVTAQPDEKSEEVNAMVDPQPRAHNENGNRKLADSPLAQRNIEPPQNKDVITEEDVEIVLVQVTPKPFKQKRRGGETDPALLDLSRVIREGQARAERRLKRLEDNSASKYATKLLVKRVEEGWGV